MRNSIKILFIDQPSQSLGLHNGIASLTAMLSTKDCEARVLDLRNLDLKVDTTGFASKPKPIDYKYLKSEISQFIPDVIGISVKSTMFQQTKELAIFLKTNFPETIIIAGGPHLSIDGIGFMKETVIDIGVVGEAEHTIQELYEYFAGSRKLNSIKGIIYRDNSKIIAAPPQNVIMDLDSLPFPDFDNFTSVISNSGVIPSYPIVTSRGCPYLCTFCLSPVVASRKWRAVSPERVLEELKYAKKKYKIKRVNFMEDNFNLDINRAKEILKLMIKETPDLVIDFFAGIRAEKIDDELIELIKKARVQCISIGIESADQEVRNILKKGVSIEKTIESIKKTKEAGINTQTFFIIGLPGSAYEKDLYSIEFAKKLGITTYWTIANAYPNTEMYEWVKKNGRMLADYKDASMTFLDEGSLNFDTEAYPADKRKDVFEMALIATRQFSRLDYSSTGGLIKHFKITRLVFKYEKKAAIIYQIFALVMLVRSILLKIGLYHVVVRNINLTVIKRIFFGIK